MALPKQVEVTVPIANIRNAPIVATSSDIGDVTRGAKLDVIGETEEFWETRTYLAKSVSKPIIVPPPPTVPEYQVWGDKEKGVIRSAAPNPEVYWLDESPVILTEAWQELIFEMNKPYMSKKWFTQNLAYNVAWANGTGFNDPNDPRRNYIEGTNLTARYPNLDKCRCCQMRLHGTESNGILTVEVLDGNQPPPKWIDLEKKPWLYFRALIVQKDGSVIDFPYCGGNPVYMPLVGIPPVTVRLNFNDTDRPAIPYITRIYA